MVDWVEGQGMWIIYNSICFNHNECSDQCLWISYTSILIVYLLGGWIAKEPLGVKGS